MPVMHGVVASICLLLQAASPESALLGRIRKHMSENLARMPDYTCRETIARAERPDDKSAFLDIDTVRVEVSYIGGKELFAWPGASKFEETRLSDLVGGTISTGSFALHFKVIFQSEAPQFSYVGKATLAGRPAVQFAFRIPRSRSRFLVKSGSQSATVGYHGWFWADPRTLDVLRLQLVTDDVPEELRIREIAETLEYGRRKIGPASFLLPLSSEMVDTASRGDQRRNRIRFDRCRQYAGESSIHFTGEADASEPTAVTEGAPLPPNVRLEVLLTSEIDMAHAAIGDPVSATVLRDVKQGGVVVVPQGATLTGRITRLTSENERRQGNYVIALRFDALQMKDTRRPLCAALESGMPQLGVWVGTAEKAVPGEGLVVADTQKSSSVLRNLRMVWRTVK